MVFHRFLKCKTADEFQVILVLHGLLVRLVCLFVCVEVIQPSQPNGVMLSAVSLPNYTRLLGRLSPLSGSTVLCTFFCQKLTIALLESEKGRE